MTNYYACDFKTFISGENITINHYRYIFIRPSQHSDEFGFSISEDFNLYYSLETDGNHSFDGTLHLGRRYGPCLSIGDTLDR